MQREILFRAKRKGNGEWVYGWPLKIKYDTKKIFIRTFPNKDDDYEDYVVIPETLCQYYGIEDKNGIKIFYNDIINLYLKNPLNGEITKQRTVIYENDNLIKFIIKYANYIEVIGNIFDEEVK